MVGKNKRTSKANDNGEESKSVIKTEVKQENEVNKSQVKKTRSKESKDWRYFGKGKNKSKEKALRGVVYVSCLPHGFYEKQLEGYFGQFGKVTGVYVPKSKKTGKSKGFAFVEFLHPEVAQVAAETMNNYLMFNRLIKTQVIPPEKQKPYMFQEKYKKMKPLYSDSKIKQSMSNQRRKLVKSGDSYIKTATNKVMKLQDSLKQLGVEYKFKVAGLREGVTLTGVKHIDPDHTLVQESVKVKEESVEFSEPSAPQRNRRRSSKVSPTPSLNPSETSEPSATQRNTRSSKVSPTTSLNPSETAVVAYKCTTKPKGNIVKKTVQLLAHRAKQLNAGKEKVTKLLNKSIDRSKKKEKLSNAKRIKNVASPAKRKPVSVKAKLETTV